MKQALAKLELLKTEFQHIAEPRPRKEEPEATGSSANRAPAQPSTAVIPGIPNAKSLVRAGASVIIGFFGFIGLWAAVSEIDSAAISMGIVGAEGSRKGVQHLDGGVVKAILVKEGNLVQEGQELILLDQTQAFASVEIQNAAVENYSAIIARLNAENAGQDRIEFPKDLAERRGEPQIQSLLTSQEQLLDARRTAIASQIRTISQQIEQANSQIAIYKGQVATADQQIKMVSEELAPKEMLFEKGYATNSPVLQLKRMGTALEGQKQEYLGNIERLEHMMSQFESQVAQIRNDYKLKVAQELEDNRNKLVDALERQRVAKDILDRTSIRAPVSGYVLGMTVNTIGGVIGKGERLLEIVPADSGITIKGRLSTSDGIEVTPGMRAELRVLTAVGRKLPVISGVVRSRSADARADAETQSLYFDVDVAITPEGLAAMRDFKLVPGTPIEVIIPTGSRTVLEYMLEPIRVAMRHGLREK